MRAERREKREERREKPSLSRKHKRTPMTVIDTYMNGCNYQSYTYKYLDKRNYRSSKVVFYSYVIDIPLVPDNYSSTGSDNTNIVVMVMINAHL